MTGDARASIVTVKAAAGLGVVFTRGASKARRTFADEAMWCITGHSTGASITTRFALTAIEHRVTALTCVSGATLAAVIVGELDTAVRSTRVTGVRQTLVHISLTALPHVSWRADAVVSSDSIHTLAFVEALWLFGDRVSEGVAVVHIDLTVNTLGSPGTGAFVGIDQVNAGAPVLARLGETFIDLHRAVGPQVSWHALAGVSTQKVGAGGAVLARVRCAFVYLLLTVAPGVSHLTVAVVNISCVQTLTRVMTKMCNIDSSLFGCHLTGNTWDVTIKARPPSLTPTAVCGICLPASSPVFTRRRVTPTN